MWTIALAFYAAGTIVAISAAAIDFTRNYREVKKREESEITD
jgi:hypothetical protein